MTITVNASRPKLEPTSPLALTIEAGTIAENDVKDTFFLPIKADGLSIPDYTVSNVAITDTTTTLTTTGNGFAKVGVGDAIAAGTAIGATTVASKTDDNTIEVVDAATGDGVETLTFTPVGGGTPINITLIGIEIGLGQTPAGKMIVQTTAHLYDGSLKGADGTDANSVRQVKLDNVDFDLDSLLETAGIPRS